MRRRRSEPEASSPAVQGGDTLSLAGAWRLRLDPNDEGLSANWADARRFPRAPRAAFLVRWPAG